MPSQADLSKNRRAQGRGLAVISPGRFVLSGILARTVRIAALLGALCALACPCASAASSKVRIAVAPLKPVQVSTALQIKGTVSGPKKVRPTKVRVERKSGRRWLSEGSAKVRAGRRFRVSWRAPKRPGAVTLRMAGLRRGKVVSRTKTLVVRVVAGGATTTGVGAPVPAVGAPTYSAPADPSPAPVLPVPPLPVGPSPEYRVPATTREYRASQVVAATDGPAAGEVLLTLAPGTDLPTVGGHIAVGPSPGLPNGMFASVSSVAPAAGGTTVVNLQPAAIDEVYDDVNYAFDGDVTPVVVDETGQPAADASFRDGTLTISGRAASAASAAAATSTFECQSSGGLPRSADDVWDTGLPFPMSVSIERPRVLHQFDAGNALLGRDPYFLLQFSGEAVASVGFTAKTGFECKLTDYYRQRHRIQMPIRNIGPVPVNIFLEPVLKFEVSAAGGVKLSQRHYFSLTFEKRGSGPLQTRRGHSSDPVKFSGETRLDATLFAGGDLALMVGAPGSASTKLSAGVYGDFGPELDLGTTTAAPGCVNLTARLRAALGLRLQLWSKRWNLEIGDLTTTPANLAGPWCGLEDPPSVPQFLLRMTGSGSLGDGAELADASPHDRVGRVHGSGASLTANALELDGASWATVAAPAFGPDFSVEAWVKMPAAGGYGIVTRDNAKINGTPGRMFQLSTCAATDLSIGCPEAGAIRAAVLTDPTGAGVGIDSSYFVKSPGAIVGDDNWHYVILTVAYDATANATTATLYADGAKRDQGTFPGPIPPGDSAYGIGNLSDTSMFSFPLQGSLDEVAVYDHALPTDVVTAHFATPRG